MVSTASTDLRLPARYLHFCSAAPSLLSRGDPRWNVDTSRPIRFTIITATRWAQSYAPRAYVRSRARETFATFTARKEPRGAEVSASNNAVASARRYAFQPRVDRVRFRRSVDYCRFPTSIYTLLSSIDLKARREAAKRRYLIFALASSRPLLRNMQM